MLLKAVDEPSVISERRVDITAVAMIVATGIDVRGLTWEATSQPEICLHNITIRSLCLLTLAKVL